MENNYKILKTLEEVKSLMLLISKEGLCTFDFETTGLEWFNDDIVPTLITFSFNVGYSHIIPLYHYDSPFDASQIDKIWCLMQIHIFENPNVIKIGHNIKYDLHFIFRYCTKKVRGRLNDTMLMHHLLDETSEHGLKPLTNEYFPAFKDYDKIVGKANWSTIDLQTLSEYASKDSDLTLRFYIWFETLLIDDDKNNRLYVLYRNLTMPAMKVFLKGEHHGAKIDRKFILESIEFAKKTASKLENRLRQHEKLEAYEMLMMEKAQEKEIQTLQEKIRNSKSDRFVSKYKERLQQVQNGQIDLYEGMNLNSSTQMKEFLFSPEGLNLPLHKDPFTGEMVKTANKDILRNYKNDFLDLLALYKTTLKMIGTYYEGIEKRLDKNDYLHSSFLLHGTRTGRLSSTDPNLQNIPARVRVSDPDVKDIFKRVKKFFITPSDEYVLLQADYSQAELRTIANVSKDPTLIKVYLEGLDVHTMTASSIAGLSVEDFKKLPADEIYKIRTLAKGANFTLIYGAQFTMYKDYMLMGSGVEVTEKDYDNHSDALFKTYPTLRQWHKDYKAKGKKFGYVRTLFGRKRRLPDIQGSDRKLVAADERLAINSPIQGTSGDWTVFSTILIDMILGHNAIFFNNVHDAIYFYIKKRMFSSIAPVIDFVAATPPVSHYFKINEDNFKVPMKLDFSVSEKNWGEVEDIKI